MAAQPIPGRAQRRQGLIEADNLHEAIELFLHGNADRVFDLATIPGSGTS